MKFRYTGGPYTTFRGRVFADGKALDIEDRGTIEALQKRSDFAEVTPEPVRSEPRKTLTVKRK